jgi:hypothetical protein
MPATHAHRAGLPLREAVRRRSLRPWLLPIAVLGVALVLQGLGGVILGFVGVLLLIDRGLDRGLRTLGGGSPIDADRLFTKLTRERSHAARVRARRHEPADGNDLVYLAVDVGWAATAQRRRLGVQSIAVDSVVGTVDRHKAATFDREFRPPPFSRGRWTLMWQAVQHGTTMPPVSVYRVGAEHYLRDGHHRVSVARAVGAEVLEAEVTELVRD